MSQGTSDRPMVMIVDDDAEMRALLRDVLERDGFAVHERATGHELVSGLERSAPDVVVLDKELSGVSGLDLLSSIKRRRPDTPVILVTAFGGADVEAEALRLGATGYMDKPFRIARLLQVLRAALDPSAGEAVRARTGSGGSTGTGREPPAIHGPGRSARAAQSESAQPRRKPNGTDPE